MVGYINKHTKAYASSVNVSCPAGQPNSNNNDNICAVVLADQHTTVSPLSVAANATRAYHASSSTSLSLPLRTGGATPSPRTQWPEPNPHPHLHLHPNQL